MAKRFIDSNLFKKKFIRELKGPSKLLWIYLFCDCDNAGIWEIDTEIASIYTDSKVKVEDLKKNFNNHLIFFDNDRKLFIPDFILFQYGELNDNNPAHKGVIKELVKYQLIDEITKEPLKPLQSTFEGTKDMDKEMDMDKVKEKVASKKFIAPELKEVIEYFKENGFTEEKAIRAFNYYSVANWVDSNGKKVLNWKQKMQANWFKNDTVVINGQTNTQTNRHDPRETQRKGYGQI